MHLVYFANTPNIYKTTSSAIRPTVMKLNYLGLTA